MKKVMLLLSVAWVAAGAHAGPIPLDADGIYGPIDLVRFPTPQVQNARPVVANSSTKAVKAKPLYLHVPTGHEHHWHAHCATYTACDVPVYFVTEGWFRSVYLPVIGRDDGREQQYLLQMGRERDNDSRDTRVERADD